MEKKKKQKKQTRKMPKGQRKGAKVLKKKGILTGLGWA